MLKEEAPRDRPDGDRDSHHRRPDADRSGTLLGVGKDVDENGERCREDQRCANAHEGSGADQLTRRGRQCRKPRGASEEQEAELKRTLTSKSIAEMPHREQECGENEGVGIDDPLQLGGSRPELSVERGQRDVHDRVVNHG